MLWLLPFKRYYQFDGRAGRAEFWQYTLVVVLAVAAAGLLDYARGGNYGVPTLALLVLLATTVPTYAVTARRLHDSNQSGWLSCGVWMLNGISTTVANIRNTTAGSIVDVAFALIYWASVAATLALVGYLLFLLASRGEGVPNRFGPPPTDVAESASQPAVQPHTDDAGNGDTLAQIERLATLHQAGALTDDEFAQQKAVLLER